MSYRLQLTALLLCTLVIFSCSPPTKEQSQEPPIPKKISGLEPRAAEKEPEPIPQLVILFEFEGIPQSTLNTWVGDRRLKIIQRQLELDSNGLPVDPADIYILSPRLITQFIDKCLVAPWNPTPNLSEVNPIFTSHAFDFDNQYAIPWRWTPMMLLQHVPDAESSTPFPQPEAPSFPDDPIMIASLQNFPLDSLKNAPTVPNPEAYRTAWETFLESPAVSAWIPAACPIRNTSDYDNPIWKWSLPQSRTTIVFDHLLVGAQSELKKEASELLNELLSPEKQHILVTTTGYFPVICPLGKEFTSSPISMPAGSWLDRSGFISLPAYTPPPAPEPAAIKTSESDQATPDKPATDAEKTSNDAPEPPTSPAPGTNPPDQTVY